MNELGNLWSADHNLDSEEARQLFSYRLHEKPKALPLEDLKKIFVSPTIITDEGLQQILPEDPDPVFSDLVGLCGAKYYFKKTAHRDTFINMSSLKSPYSCNYGSMSKVISVFNDGKFEKLLKFNILNQSSNGMIIALSAINIFSKRHIDPDILRNLFGLTLAESKIALSLHNGLSVTDAAEQTGVRVSTARDQLSSIFAKTQTSRQSELVSLLARLELVVV